jgi:hypothetical protein
MSLMKDWSPCSAASVAACEMEQGFDVLCDWILAISLMTRASPAA